MFLYNESHKKFHYKNLKKQLKQEENIDLTSMAESTDFYNGWGQ